VSQSTTQHNWKIPSTSGTYDFSGYASFSNFPNDTYPYDTASVNWIAGCQIQVSAVNIDGWVAADNNTDTSASAKLSASGTKIGDCGTAWTVQGTLTAQDGTVSSITIDPTTFFSAAGWSGNQAIGRKSQHYTFSVTATATNAQTAE